MKSITVCVLLVLSSSVMAQRSYRVDAKALAQARAAAKRLNNQAIRNILLHDSLKGCMKDLVLQAEKLDRGSGYGETALWVSELSGGGYTCYFWPKISSRRMKVEWDGYLPENTLFSIHSHPKKSGGPRPSKEDYEFNRNLGIIGLIATNYTKNISVNYPGRKGYTIVINSRTYKTLKN